MKELSGEKDEKRIIWLDFVKFIAIFMMIAVHCTDNVTPAERSEPWYNLWGSFYGSFMRPAIPLFVMVTGALLLPVEQNISAFYKKPDKASCSFYYMVSFVQSFSMDNRTIGIFPYNH